MVFESSCFSFFPSIQDNNQRWYHQMPSVLVYLLLPLSGLILLWIRNALFTRILIHIDGLYLPLIRPSFGRGRTLLVWAKGRLPQQWSSHLDTLSGGLVDFWKDGSLLCTLLNSAIPGACANPYRHWNNPPMHAQEVAFKYLGITPVFTDSDFDSHFSAYVEAKLLNYLHLIRKSIYTLEKEKLIYRLTTSKFIAKGMGLYTAEQYKQSEFYIYSRFDDVSFFNIEINILGPYSTRCRTTVFEYLIRNSKSDDCAENFQSISIQIEVDKDRVKIAYMTMNCGIHEINLSCNKETITGSPFYVNVIKGPDVSKESVQKNANASKTTNFIASCQSLEISKYLKGLSNPGEKKVRTNLPTSRDKIWANCPDYFTRENYLYFQKLVDSSFRKICRVTRTHPKFSQKKISQFSSASPICSDHIVTERYKKLSADKKRKIFALQKQCAADLDVTNKVSSFSVNENEEETQASPQKEPLNNKPLIVGEIPRIFNEKRVKSLHCHNTRRTLQRIIEEKKLFWETVFKKTEDALIVNSNSNNRDGSNGSTFKHVDSLCLHRRGSLSKSLNDLRKIDAKTTLIPYKAIDDNLLVTCGYVSLADRAKLYLENAKLGCEEIRGTKRKLSDESITKHDNKKAQQPIKKISKKFFQEAIPHFRNSGSINLSPACNGTDIDLEIKNCNFLADGVIKITPHNDKFSMTYSFRQCCQDSQNINRLVNGRPNMNVFDVLY